MSVNTALPTSRGERVAGPVAGRQARVFFHGALLAAFAVTSSALLIWPQWVSLQGAEAALVQHQERENELSGKLESLRALNQRLRDWQREGRRVFLPHELKGYDRLVKAIAGREGSHVLRVTVTGQRTTRWRPVSLEHPEVALEPEFAPANAGEIQPRLVRVVLKGGFDEVYRTVAALCGQQQLFVPERWDLSTLEGSAPSGEGPKLRAEVWGSVFMIHEPAEAPAPADGRPVAAVPGSDEG